MKHFKKSSFIYNQSNKKVIEQKKFSLIGNSVKDNILMDSEK